MQTKGKKTNKNLKSKSMKIKIAIFLIFVVSFSSLFLFSDTIYKKINNFDQGNYDKVFQSQSIIHFVDVGQGDATAISLPNGKTMLIDSGTKDSKEQLKEYLNKNVLKQSKVIDYFIITHPHDDHIGGSAMIFDEYEVKNFYRPNVYSVAEAQQEELGGTIIPEKNIFNSLTFETLIAKQNAEVGMQTIMFSSLNLPTISSQDFTFEFLTPKSLTYTNENNYSPIILFSVFNVKAVFTGDAEALVEKEGINNHSVKLSNVDILKVGHHGSSTSSNTQFINLLQPKISVISVGKGNSYKHPTEKTLEILGNVQTKIYRTDQNGNVVIGINSASKINVFADNQTVVIIEVWQIYLFGCIVAFYFVFIVDYKKIKKKLKKN